MTTPDQPARPETADATTVPGAAVDADRNRWEEMLEENPGHSQWYIERFRTMAREGRDLDGEARMIDALAPRRARVLDAGCGPGRVGGFLARRGHTVVGVDLDPALIDEAQAQHRGATWLVGNLARLESVSLPVREIDVVVCAGNVVTFLARAERRPTLEGFARRLADGGRVVVGFGTDRGYDVADFEADVVASGLRVELRLATWDLRPFDGGDFLVAVLTAA